MTVTTDTDWRLAAACRHEDPTLFFPDRAAAGLRTDDRPDLYAAPRRICRHCTVRWDCLEQALAQPHTNDQWGMYGGYAPAERQQIRRCRKGTCDHEQHRRRR